MTRAVSTSDRDAMVRAILPNDTQSSERTEGVEPAAPTASDDLVALDEALTRLDAEDPVKADLVKLRFFAGVSIDQAAQALKISRATAIRHWSFANAWLFHELHRGS